jgi:hypothetical protein
MSKLLIRRERLNCSILLKRQPTGDAIGENLTPRRKAHSRWIIDTESLLVLKEI